jgi:hypothetical protein
VVEDAYLDNNGSLRTIQIVYLSDKFKRVYERLLGASVKLD